MGRLTRQLVYVYSRETVEFGWDGEWSGKLHMKGKMKSGATFKILLLSSEPRLGLEMSIPRFAYGRPRESKRI